jgi:hypothetical protein
MAATRKREKKHEVRAKLSVVGLTKLGTSLSLEISASGEQIGALEIGRGSLTWRGGKRHRSKRLSWTAFAQQMDRLAYGD